MHATKELKTKPNFERTADRLVRAFAEQLLSTGRLTEADLCDSEQLTRKILEFARHTEVVPIIDHTASLLESASKFADAGQDDFAILLYATYFEHALNNIIDHAVLKGGASEKTKNEVIRSASISGKCGWLLEILGLPKFNARHGGFIVTLANERNAFVHYKWGPASNSVAKKAELITQAKKTVAYTKRYTSRVLFGGAKALLHSTLTSKSSGRKETRR